MKTALASLFLALVVCLVAAPAQAMFISTASGLTGPGVSESYLLGDTGYIVGSFDGAYLFEDSDGDLFWLDPEDDWIDDVMIDLFEHVMVSGEELFLVAHKDEDDDRARVVVAVRAN